MKNTEDVNPDFDFKKRCLFCKPWELDQKKQILLRSDHFGSSAEYVGESFRCASMRRTQM